MRRNSRAHARRVFVAVAFLAPVAFFGGCTPARSQTVVPLDDARLAAELNAHLDSASTVAFMAVHRAVLSVQGRDFPLTGYVCANRAGDLRLQVAGDLGPTAFDVELPAAGPARVVKAQEGIARAWLEQGAARDLAAIYRARPAANARLVEFPGRDIGYAEHAGCGETREFHFDAKTHCLVGYSVVKYRRCVYEVRFSDFGLLEGWPQPLARRVRITDRSIGYSLDIRVVEMRREAGE